MNRLLLLFFVAKAFISPLSAQNLTGIWRGYFITEQYQQYRFEVQMEQNKSNMLSGVTYSYLDKSFYGKSSMTGYYTKSSESALVQEIKTLEVKMSALSHTCIQKCLLTYVKSGKEEFLEGTFTSIVEKTDTLAGYKRGDDCGGGKMYLRKVTTSDFYIEPFLRKKPDTTIINPPVTKTNTPPVKKPDTTNKTTAANKKTTTNKPPVNNKPATSKPATTTKPPATAQKNTNTNQTKTTATAKPKKDSATKAEVTIVKPNVQNNITVKPSAKLPDKLATRENDLVKTLVINSENVTVKLYDNGEIDDDTISVYLDNKLILSKQRLTASALTVSLKMDESNAVHELVMVAENLGRIPPNTSLMIVTAGDQRFEVRITSTEQKNAVVKFKYEKP